MAVVLVAIPGAGGLVLLVIGAAIQFRNSSPSSNAPVDQRSRERFGVGARIAAAGGLGLLATALIAAWR
jgi:hypothetical protein